MKFIRSNASIFLKRIVSPIHIEYPLVTGYSDFFVIPFDKFSEFSRISGVFAAMRLFVEIAIPTVFMLIMDENNLKTQKNASLLTPKLWKSTKVVRKFEKKCFYSIKNIDNNWPSNYAYLHPVKLSEWK